MRVLEIGGAPGAAARAWRIGSGGGHILVIDRSAKGVALTERKAADEFAAGALSVRHVATEDTEARDTIRPRDRRKPDDARARRRSPIPPPGG
jgi:hypothetical protein